MDMQLLHMYVEKTNIRKVVKYVKSTII